jgi:hypothetical protein
MSERIPNYKREVDGADGSRAYSADSGSHSRENKVGFVRSESNERMKIHKKYMKKM